MPTSSKSFAERAKNESALFLALLFAGVTLLPLGIWLIGQNVFGEYAGRGFQDFFGTFTRKLRHGELSTWFLVLAPWLGISVLRLTALAWRKTGKV